MTSNNIEASASAQLLDGDTVVVDRVAWERLTAMHKWPKTTPTGHVYVSPTTYDELCSRHTDAAQASIECWVDAECPPEPTWEMVGLAHREVERLTEANAELVKRGLGAAEARDEARAAVDRVRALCDDADLESVAFMGEPGVVKTTVIRRALDGEAQS